MCRIQITHQNFNEIHTPSVDVFEQGLEGDSGGVLQLYLLSAWQRLFQTTVQKSPEVKMNKRLHLKSNLSRQMWSCLRG